MARAVKARHGVKSLSNHRAENPPDQVRDGAPFLVRPCYQRPASRVRPQGVNRGRRGFASRAIEKPPTLCTRMQMSDTGLNAPGRREGSMAKLWTLAVLCVDYGAWNHCGAIVVPGACPSRGGGQHYPGG